MNELKPCPFCGHEPDTKEIPAHKHYFVNLPPSPATTVIECMYCDYHMVGDSWPELIVRWNRRSDHVTDTNDMVGRGDSNDWVSVEERLPEEYTDVLVYPIFRYFYIGHLSEGEWRVNEEEPTEPTIIEVTHWRPIPEMPEVRE